MKKQFTKNENIQLGEVFRRLNYFKKGKLYEIITISLPSEVKEIVKLGIITTKGTEVKGVVNTYYLTDLGRRYFANYIRTISDEENHQLYTNAKIIEFDYQKFIDLSKKYITKF